jgi:hypothetical protein
MPTKFTEFLEKNKIDARRILIASRQIETLQPEDRTIRLAKRNAAKAGTKPAEGEAPKERRSGRPVTQQLLDRATAGKTIPGAAKTRVLRAINRILEQKKKEAIDLRALF